jgi:hypothetical protein
MEATSSVDLILKELVQVTIFSICTKERAQANKFMVEDGLVVYGEEMLDPKEAFDRFVNDTPLLTILRGEVMTRFIEPQPNGKAYRWETNVIIKNI